MKGLELKPIRESSEDYEALEREIKTLFRQEIYYPLLRELQAPKSTIQNSKDEFLEAIRSGRITFHIKAFFGKFSAVISKELKKLGAIWDKLQKAWKIPLAALPIEVKAAISSSKNRLKQTLSKIDAKLAKIVPDEIAKKLLVKHIFERSIKKIDQSFRDSVREIIVPPQLTDHARARIASEWENNMQLWIKDFTEGEITKLRQNLQMNAFHGYRRETMIPTIEAMIQVTQDSYDVSANKAKFLARQETSLLMSKFKQVRYADSGVHEYRWGCVAGTKNHPVRPWHKALEGKVFRWDNPPIISEPGRPVRHGNPGEDYGPCRCFARPIVRFVS
jgi:SPP1 gp7 family putative phage head morphogenesis protein